jgi:hypothetical protein
LKEVEEEKQLLLKLQKVQERQKELEKKAKEIYEDPKQQPVDEFTRQANQFT